MSDLEYRTSTIGDAIAAPEMRIKLLEDQVDRSIKRINALEKDVNNIHVVTISLTGILFVLWFSMFGL